MKVLDLFSGIGGFSLAFHRAGAETMAFCEIDKQCRSVLSRHNPNVPILNDVKEINEKTINGKPDVIAGGFPCQDVSVAGRRAGLSGERSGLWFEMLRVIKCLTPRWVVIENVRNLLSNDKGDDFATVIQGLSECGYVGAWRVLDAQYFDLAQRRERVFIVAGFGAAGARAAEILFEREGGGWNPAPSREAGQGVAGTLTGGAAGGSTHGKKSGADREGFLTVVDRDIAGAVSSKWAKGTGGPAGDEAYNLVIAPEVAHTLRGEGHDASEDGTGRGTPLIASTLTPAQFRAGGATAGNNGGVVNLIVDAPDCARRLRAQSQLSHREDADTLVCCLQTRGSNLHVDDDMTGTIGTNADRASGSAPMVISFRAAGQDGFTPSDIAPPVASTDGGGAGVPTVAFTERTRADGRNFETQEEIAYALTNPGSGGRTHSRQIAGQFGVRRLTPTECERLQGFPDGWTALGADGEKISDSARYRMLGNAVAVPVVEWIVKRLMKVDGEL